MAKGYRDTQSSILYQQPTTGNSKKKVGKSNRFGGAASKPGAIVAPPVNADQYRYLKGGGVNALNYGYNPLQYASVTNAPATNPLADMANVYNQVTDWNGGSTSPGQQGGDATGTKRKGFAGDYAPIGDDIIYDNPQIIARDVLKKMGINSSDGLMDMVGDKMGDLQFLAMLGLGGGKDSANSQTNENVFNFGADYAKQMVTPGADPMGNMQGMIQSILDAPEGSAIKKALESGTPQQQAQILNKLVEVASGGMSPLMQRAAAQVMEDRTTDWLSNKAKGNEGFLADWLQQGGNGIWG